ncbi:MAG: RtcB family protein [Pirellulaceae bacterium]|jgi:tRNA-splicing ligase RtcB|nr:RtcB family protein [Pirellulaceae bacterium]MDP7018388.1 RtcB family protein [Pirellulaceae bacterium]
MNSRQLMKIGVPEACVAPAVAGIQAAAAARELRGMNVKQVITELLAAPEDHVDHVYFGDLARSVIEESQFVRGEPISYETWGTEIDDAAHGQMRRACAIPNATAAALMPDAHVGYGLPIGGVLAVEGAVVPYAVGVDIACRMKLSVLDLEPSTMKTRFDHYRQALENGTVFGIGAKHQTPQDHAVMDDDWTVTRITRERKDTAWKQLGTSGSGNHFAEFGVVTVDERDEDLQLDPGEYVGLLSHSGSRGAGAAVCSTYSAIARAQLPKRYEDLDRLAWLDLDSQEGQEYWAAMNLMGDYAAANHDVIHRLVTKKLGAQVVAGVENHHNFAWRETHGGKDVIVHRKGATPAGAGVLGVIPGSMADPAFVVRGLGNPTSLESASHGAGRRMSRTKAKERYVWNAVRNDLAKRGVKVLSAGADEVPGVYKNIVDVMREQEDLVAAIARFDPRIVKMCGDGSKAED